MLSDETTRWTVTVSKETDIAVRSLLAQRGMKKGDLSRFIEDAVRWRVLDQSIAESRKAFSEMQPDDIQALIDEATGSVRREMGKILRSSGKVS